MTFEQTYLVNEIYPCLQGEGTNIGRPSILVRFQICNLRCTWCDTPYTHTLKSDPSVPGEANSKQNFRRFSLSALLEKINSFGSIGHIILSGGEPTLQNLGPLITALNLKFSIEVESNGTQIPHALHSSFDVRLYDQVQWNISPKGANAGQEIDEEALSHWSQLAQKHPRVFFKFVVRKTHSTEDFEEIKNFATKYNLPGERIILMAEGTSPDSQMNNHWLEEICLTNGWMLTPRLHVLTHGSRRGV